MQHLFLFALGCFLCGRIVGVLVEFYGRRRMCRNSLMYVPGTQFWVRRVISHGRLYRYAKEREVEEAACAKAIDTFVPVRKCRCHVCGDVHDDRRYL